MNLRRRMEDDLHRDIRDHIEMETAENIARGMSPEDARFAALRKFGNVLHATEDTHAVWRWMWAERLLLDTRYALRTLRRNPVFATVAVLTLALGIGMNTAVFSVVNAVLIEPLAYPHPERLVWLADYNEAFKAEVASGPDYLDWRAQAQSFDKMVAYGYNDMTLAYGEDAYQHMVASVTSDFWELSGAQPAAGRLIADDERDAIVLSHALFERRFAGDLSILGKPVNLNGRPMTVVGVLPASFHFLLPAPARPGLQPRDIEAYTLSNLSPATQSRSRAMSLVNVVARMKPGVTLQQARTEMETIQTRIAQQNPGISYRNVQLRVTPAAEKLLGNGRQALLILLGAVAFVLLIACANIAGLLLARATVRRREVAIRAAVGAGRRRMIAQFLAEGVVLALAGGAAGILVARAALALLLRFGPQALPRLENATINGRILAFTLLASLASGLLFGLGPAISLARTNLHDVLKQGGKASSSGASPLRLRSLLVATELAIALVLLMGAGLMVKSLWRMSARPPGFHPEKILVMKVALSGPAYRDNAPQLAYLREALRRLQQIPGVAAAGTVYSPVRGVLDMEGAPQLPPGQVQPVVYYSTSSGYFQAMGIRLIEGRWLNEDEPSHAILVNDAFVRRVMGGASPLGKRVRLPGSPASALSSIVGVVSDVKYSKLDQDPGPEIYFPDPQSFFHRASDIVVRTTGDPLAIAPVARKLVNTIDPTQPVFGLDTLDQSLAKSVAPRRFNLLLLGVFAAAALLLAIIGTYGVMSYAVSQRTQEIGIRLALGARRGEIVRIVVQQGMLLALAGIAAGTAAALALTRLMAALLFDVKPNDPWILCGVALALAITAFLASALPAVKASRVDPLTALRYE